SGKNIIRWLLKKRTNGSVRYCQYTSLTAINIKPRLQPTNRVFTFIHLGFASSQDFVLSARVGQRHF
ncbi:hypothetical protein OSL38_28795, partial [Escherichia coli]|nr:hypothetical protein [Escherichia coli]MDA6599137.1 hypothetical protein [Escherichia coli]MDA6880117.1 hypothetical protein [Escherichia coli]MDA6914999.1 hypothetical protein [Escherichia coli]MDA6920775.1 hypothetical protein [Escherichia coli]